MTAPEEKTVRTSATPRPKSTTSPRPGRLSRGPSPSRTVGLWSSLPRAAGTPNRTELKRRATRSTSLRA